jgi:hypothetical protein
VNTPSNPNSSESPEPTEPPESVQTVESGLGTNLEASLESQVPLESSESLDNEEGILASSKDQREDREAEKVIHQPSMQPRIEATTADSESWHPKNPGNSGNSENPENLQNPTPSDPPQPLLSSSVKKDFERQSRRSFLVFGAAAVGGLSGFRWLQSTSTDGGIHWPLRKGLNASSALQRAVLGDSATVATHAKSEARELRRNGSEGVKTPLGPNDNQQTWMIEVQRNGIRMGALRLADLVQLPQVEQTVDHKCVEGWSQIVTWKGVKMADVLARAEELVEGKRAEHIGFATPDKGYYVTLERSAVKHPQTLLALSLNGEELTDKHGAPCRLAIPTRYGIKSIKRVGIINLSDSHASDYWGQRGYDLYAAF